MESWLSKFRKNRAAKRTEKLRKRFEFLIDEINLSQDKIAVKMLNQEKDILNAEIEQLESINECKTLLNEIIKKFDNIIISNQHFLEENKLILENYATTFGDRAKRSEEKIVSVVDERNSIIQSTIENGNAIVEGRTDSILLSIDEVKTLMKIIAVNNLLDEI